MVFGARLRELRRAARLTIEQLADASGVSARAISDMERGRSRSPQARTVAALADGLRLDDAARVAFASVARAAGAPSAAGRPRLCELPRGVTDFVGRSGERAVIATAARAHRSGPVPVVLLHGQAGLGKTALAVHVAADLREDFPDGALYVDLRGVDPVPLPTGTALYRLLRALGVSGRIADGDDERSARLRAVLRDRRCLLVLDNAGSEVQVRPLLPAVGPGLVVVTSRRALGGLEGVTRIGLPPLTTPEAADLLRALAVQAADPAATEQVATVSRLCGHLPLALRIAGTRLASRSRWTVDHLADRLADADRRLAELASGDTGVEAAFALSYAQLPDTTATVFRRLAHVPGPDLAAPLAAVLTGTAVSEAEDRLDELVEYGLLQPQGVDRYRLHDLLALYAADRLRAEEPPETRTATVRRMTDWLLETAIVAGRRYDSRFESMLEGGKGLVPLANQEEAGAWLRAETDNWLAALRHAAAEDRHQLVVDVVEATAWHCDLTARWRGWYEIHRLASDAARALPDPHQEVRALNSLAFTAIYSGRRPAEGVEAAKRAHDLATGIGAVKEQVRALRFMGEAYVNLEMIDDALSAYRAAYAVADRGGEHEEYVSLIVAAGFALERAGRYDEGIREQRQALTELDRRPLSPRGSLGLRVCALDGIAVGCCLLGRWEETLRAADRALPALAEFGEDLFILARLLMSRGVALVALGRPGEGRVDLVRGLELADGQAAAATVARRLTSKARDTLSTLGDGESGAGTADGSA